MKKFNIVSEMFYFIRYDCAIFGSERCGRPKIKIKTFNISS